MNRSIYSLFLVLCVLNARGEEKSEPAQLIKDARQVCAKGNVIVAITSFQNIANHEKEPYRSLALYYLGMLHLTSQKTALASDSLSKMSWEDLRKTKDLWQTKELWPGDVKNFGDFRLRIAEGYDRLNEFAKSLDYYDKSLSDYEDCIAEIDRAHKDLYDNKERPEITPNDIWEYGREDRAYCLRQMTKVKNRTDFLRAELRRTKTKS